MITRLVDVGRSLTVGAALGVIRTRPRRLRALDMAPFASALATLAPDRDRDIGRLLDGASIATVQQLMERGALSSEELAIHLIARIRRLEPSLGSFIELDPSALDEARALDAQRRSGLIVGPLHGIPMSIKDNIETAAPMHTTAGAIVLADHVASGDAPVVSALRGAGAVILGKANLSELAGAVVRTPGVSAVGGPTHNPHGARFTPGGSSSGSAVSVAAGLVMASVGTETSGSLIAPASFNGVVGMKPSAGLVPQEGIVPLVSAQDSAGPIAGCVADVARLLSVMVAGGLQVDLSPSALQGISVGILRADILDQRTPLEDTSDNPAILARLEDGLLRAGAVTSDVGVASDSSLSAFEAGSMRVVLGGLSHDTMAYLAAAGAAASSVADLHAYNLRSPRARMPKGQFFLSLAHLYDIDEVRYRTAVAETHAAATRLLEPVFGDGPVAVLVSLSNRHSPLYAAAGCPAISVPLGLRATGMPVGATLIGRPGSDAELLGYAYALEQATKLRVTPTDTAAS